MLLSQHSSGSVLVQASSLFLTWRTHGLQDQ